MLTNFVDFNDIENPLKNIIENVNSELDAERAVHIEINERQSFFSSVDSLLQVFPTQRSIEFLDWEKDFKLQYTDRETRTEPMFSMRLAGTHRKENHSRQVYDLMALFADMGGTYGTFYFFGVILNWLFNSNIRAFAYLEQIYLTSEKHVTQRTFETQK